jgi:hypothetical protein
MAALAFAAACDWSSEDAAACPEPVPAASEPGGGLALETIAEGLDRPLLVLSRPCDARVVVVGCA